MIKHNPDIDFLVYINMGTNIDDIRKANENEERLSHTLNNEELKELQNNRFKEAESFVTDSLSYMLRTNANLFFKKTHVLFEYLMQLYEKNENLENQNTNDFKAYISKHLKSDRNDFSKEELLETIKQEYDFPNSFEDYEKSAELVHALINDEDMFEVSFKSTVKELKSIFMKEKIEPFKDEIQKILEKDNKIFSDDSYKFLSNISFGLLKKSEINVDEYNVFLLFTGLFQLRITRNSIIYDVNMEKLFDVDMENELLTAFMKFVSDRKRYQMLQVLKKEKKYANELAKQFKITPATMSYHINKLYGMGLISFDKSDQNKMYIKLNKERLASFLNRMKIDLLD